MLIQFSVENFLSFKNRVTLSMVAATGAKEDPETENNLLTVKAGTDLRLLKTAAIYGANASGKSNVIRAMIFMSKFLRDSSSKGQSETEIPVSVFALDDRFSDKPSFFEIVFILEGVRHAYGFEIDRTRVHHEWLYVYHSKKPRLAFERKYINKYNIYLYTKGTGWKGKWETIQSLTRPNALFLSVASQFNNEVSGRITAWFTKMFRAIKANPASSGGVFDTNKLAKKDSNTKESILKVIKQADLGIEDFQLDAKPFREFFVGRLKAEGVEIAPDDDFLHKLDETGAKIESPIFFHPGFDNSGQSKQFRFEFQNESDGTQKFYATIGLILHVLANGCTLVADELDMRLHPLLTRWIIKQFHNPETNPKGAQLIFAAHDANLLDRSLFRRDQIWFTEKDNSGATQLFSLWDFKARNREDIRKKYLLGLYGAIPFLKDIEE